MDSKVKVRAFIIGMLLIVTIIGAVIFTNTDTGLIRNAAYPAARQEEMQSLPEKKDLSAFMRDDTFFDDKPEKKAKKQQQLQEEVAMHITSVEKDIRIQVLDGMGELLSGHEIYVNLDTGEQYKDLDRDGVIYIPDLKAGDYYVTLGSIPDYSVPTAPTKVRVKDRVTYTEIKDISLLIKTEAEIDAQKEDTGVRGALEEGDETEIKNVRPSDGKARFGIDVSKWNKEIDWNKAAQSGVEYAIIRVGYRGSSSGALVEDPYFRKNIEGAQKAGIKVGLYFFTQAVSEVEAVEEASMALSLCAEDKVTYPIFIDTEGAGGNGRADALDKETRTAVCAAFCETIRSAGYDAGVYASRNWYYRNLNTEELERYVIWLAEYRETPEYTGTYHMWQYTSNGSIEGIEGRVDMDLSYLAYE